MTGDLERLAALHDAGALTDAEFAAAKAAVVGAPVPGVDVPLTPVEDPPEKGSLAGFWVFVGILVILGTVWLLGYERRNAAAMEASGALDYGLSSAGSTMDAIEQQVAMDAADQYAVVARFGSGTDRCVHAGLVAAAYVQAGNAAAYDRWKATERADCAAIGLER